MTSKILVVGARGGVGGALAGQLLDRGHAVIGTVRNEAQAVELRADEPRLSEVLAMDLANADQCLETLRAALTRHADLTGVAVCAAVSSYGPLETTPLARLRSILEINTLSCLAVYQASLPVLRRTRGRLVLISSYSGRLALPFLGHYQASKFALEALGDVMRQECRRFGVTVSLVEPGGIETAMKHGIAKSVAADAAALPEEEAALYGDYYRQFSALTNAPTRHTSPETVAATVIDALESPLPHTRYVVGPDAEFLIGKRAALSDEDWDAFGEQLYGNADAAT